MEFTMWNWNYNVTTHVHTLPNNGQIFQDACKTWQTFDVHSAKYKMILHWNQQISSVNGNKYVIYNESLKSIQLSISDQNSQFCQQNSTTIKSTGNSSIQNSPNITGNSSIKELPHYYKIFLTKLKLSLKWSNTSPPPSNPHHATTWNDSISLSCTEKKNNNKRVMLHFIGWFLLSGLEVLRKNKILCEVLPSTVFFFL